MLVKSGIIPLSFATLPVFCSASESPLNGCGVEIEERTEQKKAKAAKEVGTCTHRPRFAVMGFKPGSPAVPLHPCPGFAIRARKIWG